VGFGAKRAAPRTSLGTLFLAAQFLDLLWPTLLLLGLEHVEIRPGITRVTPLDFTSYPLSHSLALALVWGALFGIVYWLLRRYRTGAVVAAVCVISHWILDVVVHRPDLPLLPNGGVKVGFGVWSSLPATLCVEALVFGAGLIVYVRRTEPVDRVGRFALSGLVLLLVVIYLASVFGPPPPSTAAIPWAGQAQWLIVALGYWVDRHRRTTLVHDRTR
jgi:membrane-bound metal-dependent hydrolase YbcI (DUF457 family)